jgi:2-polyprenyl-3-methyl-5-hydroxy-6-metoxy-1,4-benzoquinol methylase
MTIWDKIYKDFEKGGEAWATLKEGLIPQFTKFVESSNFTQRNALDIGCGTGKYLLYLHQKGFTVTGIDSSETAISMCREKAPQAKLECVNMFEYKIAENTHDFIFSISTIHHGLKSDIKNLITRIYKSLLPNGKVLITFPDIESARKWNTFKGHTHIDEETFAPKTGPETGLAHSFYTRQQILDLFSSFKNVQLELDEIGRWFVTAEK